MKISVVINTYNASEHLPEVLESVKAFDEILICDMESTDDTLQIAARYGCRVVTFPRGKYNIVEPARDFAIRQAKHHWVLVVDADEVVPEALRKYLYNFVSNPDSPDGLFIPRKNYFMGRFMHCLYPDHILRFFRRDKTVWPPVIHCAPEVDGIVSKIPAGRTDLAFEHLANDSVGSILVKTDKYTDNEVPKKMVKNYGTFAFVYRPAFRFIKTYFIKGGFRDGVPGLVRASLESFYQFVVLAKIAERKINSREK